MQFSAEQLQIVQDNRQWSRQRRIDHAWFMLTAKDVTKEDEKFWRAILEMNTVK